MAEDLQNRLLAWLETRWVGPKSCPICTANNWTIGHEIIEVRPYTGGNLVVGGAVYPVAQLICNNCGHVLFFNAKVADLVEDTDVEAPESEPEQQEGKGS